MKHILLSLLMTAVATSAMAQTDTVKVVRNVNHVTVTRSSDGSLFVDLKGKPKDDEYIYHYGALTSAEDSDSVSDEPKIPLFENKKKTKTWQPLWFSGCYVGFKAQTGDNDFNLKTGRSWEVGLSTIGIKYRPWQSPSYFTATLDFIAHQYSTGKSNLLLSGNKPLTAIPTSDGMHVKYNNISMCQISVPIMYHQNIYKNFELGLGAQLNWNILSYAQTQYTVDGDPMKHSGQIRGLNQRPFTVDLIATLGWRNGVQLYVRYSPMRAYKAEFGPDLQTISFGIRFGF